MPERSEIHRCPVLNQPAVADPEDVDELELYAVPGRWQIPDFTQVRPPECLARGDKVALGELVIDLHGGVRKALQHRAVERLEAARRPVCRRKRDPTWPV